MVRAPVNPHGFDEMKLREDINQKIIDRFTAYQTDTRTRVDTLVKSIFVMSGGALTISIGVFLRNEAPPLDMTLVARLQCSWALLFFSLAASAVVLFTMILQGYRISALWQNAQKTGNNEIESSPFLKVSRMVNWLFGVSGFLSFLVGLGLLAYVSVAAIGSPNNTLNATRGANAPLAR